MIAVRNVRFFNVIKAMYCNDSSSGMMFYTVMCSRLCTVMLAVMKAMYCNDSSSGMMCVMCVYSDVMCVVCVCAVM